MEDTIVAVSTALGEGAISIIRVSGKEAIKIVSSIFDGKDLNKVSSHTINYGHIVYQNEVLDEVLIMLMKAPKTYTKEDVVEINCHGSIAVVNKILEVLLLKGCRLANPGEFTKRAFLNGRIDLTEAEGVMDLINSETDMARKQAINEISGGIKKQIIDLRSNLSDLISNIEVNIDYPEYEDIEVVTKEKVTKETTKIIDKLEYILRQSKDGKIIKDGIKTIIIGKPNVGKSSLLNVLLGEEKAIVTDVKGTTRDVLEDSIVINGVKLDIIDTAGVRNATNKIEKIGIEKTIKLIDEAELVLLLLDNGSSLTKEDKYLLDLTSKKKRIVIINKVDLHAKNSYQEKDTIKISTKTKEGIDVLKSKIVEMFNIGSFNRKNLTYFTSARQISLLKEALQSLKSAKEASLNGALVDMLEIDLKQAWDILGEIIGVSYDEELINNLFSRFCVGK